MRSLYESILDDEDEVMDRMGVEAIIHDFLKTNYFTKGYEIVNHNTVNLTGHTILKPDSKIKHLTNGSFKFGIAEGCTFDCSKSKIEDLEGAPEIVGSFLCNECDNLKSLKGSPKKVKIFKCRKCPKLKTLEGGPEEISFHFSCTRCSNLTSLKGAPKICEGDFACSYTNIKDLSYCPEIIEGDFSCHHCEKLKSLKGSPKSIYGVIDMHDNDNLKGYIIANGIGDVTVFDV